MVEAVTQASTNNGYSRLVAWEVFNFMSIERGRAEFDERGIVNFKGYNDSGKSTMLRALDVLMYNIKPKMQTSFIQDEKAYFRVMAYFDDGVIILRDKYSNGQSLYEMYKGGECIFTTKQGNLLTKVTCVPDAIAQYLGLISYGDMYLNSRSCFDKQLLVQTTGSENYKFLHAVLKSEEIAIASELANTDKNRVISDISATEMELDIYRNQTAVARGVTKEMVDGLKDADKNLDTLSVKLSSLGECKQMYVSAENVPDIPQVDKIDNSRLSALAKISGIMGEISGTVVTPEVPVIGRDRLAALSEIKRVADSLESMVVTPEVAIVDLERLNALIGVSKALAELKTADSEVLQLENEVSALINERDAVSEQLEELDEHYVKCPNCGTYVATNKG